MPAKTTVHEKERWLLDQPSLWRDYHKLSHVEQTKLLNILFRRMREAGYYSTTISMIDGRVSLSRIIERLLDKGRGDGTL